MKDVRFDEAYYQDVIDRHGYRPLGARTIDFALPTVSVSELAMRWLCHHDGDLFARGIEREAERCVVTTGIGLSGDPHIGTLSQILRAIFLQQRGCRVQLVLGDLDSYNARGGSLESLIERAERYRRFVLALGFDPEVGTLRPQVGHPEIQETSYLIARCLRDEDFAAAEEDLSDLYQRKGIHSGMSFPIKQAILLMVADFIHLGWRDGYGNVLVSLGIEEHMYVRLARAVVERMALGFAVSAMYSRLIVGFSGYPKMSKSIPESSIYVTEPATSIRRKIMEEENEYEHPGDSVVFQMMAATTGATEERLRELAILCGEQGEGWRAAKARYADELIALCALWREA